jgi:hypothetical protein
MSVIIDVVKAIIGIPSENAKNHEASHGVVAKVVGLQKIKIVVSGNGGYISYDDSKVSDEQHVKVAIAGIIGEQIISGRPVDINDDAADYDIRSVISRGINPESYVNEVISIINDNRSEIERVAKVVGRKGSIDY